MANITTNLIRDLVNYVDWSEITSDKQGGGDDFSGRSPTVGGRKLTSKAKPHAQKSSAEPGDKKSLPWSPGRQSSSWSDASDFTVTQQEGGDYLSESPPKKKSNVDPRPSPQRGEKKTNIDDWSQEKQSSEKHAEGGKQQKVIAKLWAGGRFPLFDVIYSLFAAVIGSSILISVLAMPLWIVYEAEMLRVNM